MMSEMPLTPCLSTSSATLKASVTGRLMSTAGHTGSHVRGSEGDAVLSATAAPTVQQPVVGDDDEGVHALLQGLNGCLRLRAAGAVGQGACMVQPAHTCCTGTWRDLMRPSKLKGVVTMATVSTPMALAMEATTGAAPLPVPPPMPACTSLPGCEHALGCKLRAAACSAP